MSTVSSSSSSSSERKTKRSKNFEFVALDTKFEREIVQIGSIKELSEDLIYYMVLRDGNDYIDIFSGCLPSWRHAEYKKKNKNYLCENAALSNFTQSQFMSAFKGLEWIFCKNTHKYDDYLLKVLLPEALIRICSRVYDCDKEDAEDFLRITHRDNFSLPKNSKKIIVLD